MGDRFQKSLELDSLGDPKYVEPFKSDGVSRSNYFYCKCPSCGHDNAVRSDFTYQLGGFVQGHRCASCLGDNLRATDLVLDKNQVGAWTKDANTPPVERWRLPRDQW